MKEVLTEQITLLNCLIKDETYHSRVAQAITDICTSLTESNPLLVCGNGGSSADALHIAAELVGRFEHERRPHNVICLNSNPASMTAISNDYSFSHIFSRQVLAYGSPGSILWAISTSGRSPNILEAIATADTIGIKTILMTGSVDQAVLPKVDILLPVPSLSTPRIQELHQLTYHYICQQVEQRLLSTFS